MALSRDKGAVKNTGSGKATAFECDSEGTVTGTKITFPWIKESTLSDVTDVAEIETEGEDTFSDTGKRTVKWEATFLQRDKDSVEMMVKTYRDKYMSIFKEQSDKLIGTAAPVYQYLSMVICKVNPTVEIASPGTDLKIMFDLQSVQSAVTMTLTDFDDDVFKGNVTGDSSFTPTTYPYWQYNVFAAA